MKVVDEVVFCANDEEGQVDAAGPDECRRRGGGKMIERRVAHRLGYAPEFGGR